MSAPSGDPAACDEGTENDVSVESLDGMETWKSNAAGMATIKKSVDGKLQPLTLRGRRVFHVTPNERRMNEAEHATDALNPWKNGTFTAVRLIDSEADAEEIKANPHQMTEQDMKDLLLGHHKTFDKRVAEISNVAILKVMRALADEMDDPSPSVKKVAVLEARVKELDPNATFVRNIEKVGSVGSQSEGDPGPKEYDYSQLGPNDIKTAM